MRTWEELQHGDDWWYLEVCILSTSFRFVTLNPFQGQLPSGNHVLFLIVYMDETNVSIIGGVKVWPVYVWVGNLPASIRKQRNKKGGAVLVGYLPEVCYPFLCLGSFLELSRLQASSNNTALSSKDLAELRVSVYHDALALIFESLKIAARNGAPMQCGDGVIRVFHPTIGAISADYMEL